MTQEESNSSEVSTNFKSNEWKDLIKSVYKRWRDGFNRVDFILYFLFVIIVVGSLGVFPSALKYYEAVILKTPDRNAIENDFAKSLSTYFITIIATSSADLILNKEPNEHEARILRMPAVTCLIIGAISIFLIHSEVFGSKTVYFSFLSTAFSLFVWWIANSWDKKYQKNTLGTPNANFAPLGKEQTSHSQGVQSQMTQEEEVTPVTQKKKIQVKM